MTPELAVLAAAHGGVFSSRDAASVGIPTIALTRWVAQGQVIRVRRGAYVDCRRWREATVDQRFGLRVRAVLRDRPADAASHQAALTLTDVPIFGLDLSVIDLASAVGRVRTEAGLRLHRVATTDREIVQGYRAVPVAVALAQVAARESLTSAVVALDYAFHRELCAADEVRAGSVLAPARRRGRVERALQRSDPASESVGESRLRLLLQDLGYAVRTQVPLRAGGRFLGRVDVVVDDCVVVEFDGLVKYAGLEGKAALAAEKQRESDISAALYEVVRVVWSELEDVAALDRRIRIASHRARSRREAAGWVPVA